MFVDCGWLCELWLDGPISTTVCSTVHALPVTASYKSTRRQWFGTSLTVLFDQVIEPHCIHNVTDLTLELEQLLDWSSKCKCRFIPNLLIWRRILRHVEHDAAFCIITQHAQSTSSDMPARECQGSSLEAMDDTCADQRVLIENNQVGINENLNVEVEVDSTMVQESVVPPERHGSGCDTDPDALLKSFVHTVRQSHNRWVA
jgi:hypothetical protein